MPPAFEIFDVDQGTFCLRSAQIVWLR
jgi:hypothetical protein